MDAFNHMYMHLAGGLEGGSGAEPVSVVDYPEAIVVTYFAQQLYHRYSSSYLSRKPSTADHSFFSFVHLSLFPLSPL